MPSPRCPKCNKVFMSGAQLDHHTRNAERLCEGFAGYAKPINETPEKESTLADWSDIIMKRW